MSYKPKIGVSRCLLGEKVRYDGGHKLDHYLHDIVSQFVEWAPVCPEVECGLPIPREAVRLVGDPSAPRLLTSKTGMDHTERMQSWAKVKIAELEPQKLSGFVFKAKSPSSGMSNIKIYNEDGFPHAKGSGMFAKAFMDHFPLIPVEDDGRLNDADLRENFIERIFVYQRWQDFVNSNASISSLVDFHSNHKLLIMAHSPTHLRELGKLVAGAKNQELSALLNQYITLLMTTLKLIATVKKNVNVLQHIMGYFKKQLTADEKQELLEIIDAYHKGLTPLITPITLLNHYVRKYQEPYLLRQVYLNPHPIELMLRNHV